MNSGIIAGYRRRNADITNGLVGWWKTFSGDSIAVDSSGNRNDGVLDNGTTITTGPNSGQAATFDGTNDQIVVPYTSMFDFGTTGSFSLTHWVYFSGTYSSEQDVIGKMSPSLSNGWHFRQLSSTSYSFRIRDSGGTHFSDTGVSITRDSWNFIVGVIDRDSQQLSISNNGGTPVIINISAYGSLDSSVEFRWGDVRSSTLHPFNGSLADVRLYNRTLSLNEISTLYSNGAKPILVQEETTSVTSTDARSTRYLAGKFTATSSFTISSITVKLAKQNSPSGTITIGIFSDSSGLPGTQIGSWSTITYDISLDVTTTNENFSFDISSTFVGGTSYWIVVDAGVTGDGVNYLKSIVGNVASGNVKVSTDLSTWSNPVGGANRQLYYSLFK